MYASILYNGSETREEAIGDIVGLLTGLITNVSQLSTNADQPSSVITTTVPGGWELWDDRLTEENYAVLRSAISDDPSRHKYIKIEYKSTTRIGFDNYKDWDNTLHTGTALPRYSHTSTSNQDSSNYIFRNDNNYGCLLLLSSSSNHIAGTCKYGVNQGSTAPMSITTERTRHSPWDTVDNGYIPIVFNTDEISDLSQYRSFNTPEYVRYDGMEYIYSDHPENNKTKNSVTLTSPYYQSDYSSFRIQAMPTSIANENLEVSHMIFPLGVSCPSEGNLGGDISSKCKIYMSNMDNSNTPTANSNDIYQAGGKQYRIWKTSTNLDYFMVLEE